jgi:sugar lactone lactonase YvrE
MKPLFAFLACALVVAHGQTRYVITTIAGREPFGDGGPANQALLFSPTAIAADAKGNIFIADTFNSRIRKVSSGTISTVACSGINGSGGDGGPAIKANCDNPNGVGVDSAGNIYIADSFSSAVRKVTPDGTISRVAGNGQYGSGGDGGPATSASLERPTGVITDNAGNLYIADAATQRIRRVSPDGSITTVAGTGACDFTGDGGPATQAAICGPFAMAIDPQGRILFADAGNSRIRRFTPGGAITTVAGTFPGFSGDGGPATNAALNAP